jgi:predicted RNase H-related nuclease YkuK (DUF458 family)
MITEADHDIWITGSGKEIRFSDLCESLNPLLEEGSKLFIGSDSNISKRKITFCKTICVYGRSNHSKYFFKRTKVDFKKFPNLISRITEEARLSIELAEYLTSEHRVPTKMIELHLDVSSTNLNHKTSKFCDMLKGYVNGAGFECKIKPNAWASQSIADKHSK